LLRKIDLGGGYLYKQLNKDVKEINKVFLSLFSVGIILIAIFVGINLTKSSYALFSDKVVSTNTIGVEVDTCNLYVPNEPILDNSMIPVYYDEEESVWKKADSTNQDRKYKWYDYCEKKWANSVTVTETNRETYLNAALGTEIKTEDILTMQVWIPRYKYKVWNYNSDGTVTSEPQEIEIVFEEGTASTGDITCRDTISGTNGAKSESCKINNVECTDSTCNNKYYTHPAFTFGTEELEGFWIGKFELTGTIDNITTKPNISSLRSQTVSSFETNIMAMNDESNIYGFSSSADTHMIKNMEWGAISYLSHSRYGICSDGVCYKIYRNNNSNYLTGCGSSAGSSETTTCNTYNTEEGMLASTTGNIYGIYDMNGGANDYVMGNVVSPDGEQMMSGYSATNNSGYTGIIYAGGNYTSYTGTYSYPNSKYYDKYSYGTSFSQIIRSKLGDSIKEVKSDSLLWYNGNYYMAHNLYPWFVRGMFTQGNGGGGRGPSHSTHLIIIS